MPELLQRRFTFLMPKYMGFQRSLKHEQITIAGKGYWIPSIQFFAADSEKIAIRCKFKRNCPLLGEMCSSYTVFRRYPLCAIMYDALSRLFTNSA